MPFPGGGCGSRRDQGVPDLDYLRAMPRLMMRHEGDPVAEHERPEDWGWHGETGRWGRIGAIGATLPEGGRYRSR